MDIHGTGSMSSFLTIMQEHFFPIDPVTPKKFPCFTKE